MKDDNQPVRAVEGRRAPFLWISKTVFNQKWHVLSTGARSIYVTLCAFADGYHSDDGMVLTIETFAVRNAMSRTSVWRALTELEEHGLIRVENQFDADRGQLANRYILVD